MAVYRDLFHHLYYYCHLPMNKLFAHIPLASLTSDSFWNHGIKTTRKDYITTHKCTHCSDSLESVFVDVGKDVGLWV